LAEDAVTFACATGACVVANSTVPFNDPVTPASAHVPWTSNTAIAKKAILSKPFMVFKVPS
ncbi:MAG TPA: hypothetical protein VGX02_04440, partial [Candidatus Eremiobacteraceae bacterium]|nr:hypothetical protein [Candidatus Eremiobacteraceae bacterium]